jgi:aspartyl-tRNA(Asn)/glutamyl-tRNA(Gln) amidotransferase subunit B
MPICIGGYLDVPTESGGNRRVRITRIHMEEDAGKNIHAEDGSGLSFVDFNRCGTPLLEIVSEPDLRSPAEASAYVEAIREILRSLGVSDCNMEEGSLRCDANVNLWIYENGEKFATPIAEIKNMNSFRSIRGALEYEEKRQLREWEENRLLLRDVGKTTRGYVESKGVTVLQRAKEEASDYRYFPEPDLKPVHIGREYVARVAQKLGELPSEMRERLVEQYGLTEQDALNLSGTDGLVQYFEEAAAGHDDPRRVANMILAEVKKYLNAAGIELADLEVSPSMLRDLIDLVDSGKISGKIAKEVFEEMADTGDTAETVVERNGLSQIGDAAEIETIVDQVIAENPSSVEDYRNGKEKAIGFLMGRIMKKTQGKANPGMAMELLKSKMR